MCRFGKLSKIVRMWRMLQVETLREKPKEIFTFGKAGDFIGYLPQSGCKKKKRICVFYVDGYVRICL